MAGAWVGLHGGWNGLLAGVMAADSRLWYKYLSAAAPAVNPPSLLALATPLKFHDPP